jgi:CRP-like cAMP-binding protein
MRYTSAGEPVILLTLTPEEILCGVSAFDQRSYAADAIAATQCRLLRIPSEFFGSLLNESSEFCREMLSICAERIRTMAEKLGGMSDPVSHRIARVLLASVNEFPNKIPFTHRDAPFEGKGIAQYSSILYRNRPTS